MADEFLKYVMEDQGRLLRLLKEQIQLAREQDANILDIHKLCLVRAAIEASIKETVMATMGGLR